MRSVHTLKNGIRVVTDPMPGLETAAIGVWAHAGSVDETPKEHGIAHLLEHMAFKGTKKRSARDIAEEIESVGGYLNAATSHQRTGYYARVLKDDVSLAIDILSDILKNPAFHDEDLKKEQEVVVQEIGEAADTPDDVVFERLTEITWPGHPLGRTILGTPDSVRAQTATSLRGFMSRCYRPEEIVVAAAGAIDPVNFNSLVESAFGAVTDQGTPSTRIRPAFSGGVYHDDRDIEQTHLALAFPGVASGDDDFFATRLCTDILGGGMSSRLFQKVREEKGLAYTVYAFADGFEHCGLFGAYVNAEAEQIVKAAEIIHQELKALPSTFQDEEIGRVKALLRSSLMMGLESPASRIEASAAQLFVYGSLMSSEEILRCIDDVTIDDLIRCAERAIAGPCAVSMVGPGDADAVAAIFNKT